MPESINTTRQADAASAPAAPPVESGTATAPVSRPGWSARDEAAWNAGRKVGGVALGLYVRAWFTVRNEVERRKAELEAKCYGVRAGESAGYRLREAIGRIQKRAGELDPGGFLREELRSLILLAEVALAEAEG